MSIQISQSEGVRLTSFEEGYFISQIVAAVAAIVSLLFVGYQVRQSTVSQNALMHQQLVASQNDANRAIVDSQEIADLLARANVDVDALMPSEHARLNTLYIYFFGSSAESVGRF